MLNIRKRFFLLLTIIGALICFVACTKTDTLRVSFDQTVYEIKVGQTLDITPIIDNESSVNTIQYEYLSTDSTVATFVDGKLTGVQQGETMIKVVCNANQKSDGSSITVYDIAKVIVSANSLPDVNFVEPQKTMVKGTNQTLQYSFIPEYASATMTFSSANPDVASVDEKGVITAVGVGTAVIVARATDVEIPSQYQDYTFVIEVIEADFVINYELNGGVNHPENPAGYNVLTLPLEVLAPTRDSYKFLGWYDNAECTGNAITSIAVETRGDITLYAKWELVEFAINYDLDGGVNHPENPTVYNVEGLPLTLGSPTKNGYNFVGWYKGETEVTEIVAGTTGEVNLTAKWELATYKITFNLNGGAWQDLEGKVYPYGMDREAMVRDFVVDFNAYTKKTVAADGSDFFARSWMADNTSAGYSFLVSAEYGEKWLWMLNYLNDTRVLNGKTPLSATDGQAEARGEIHNFLNACAPGEKGGNAAFGCDYSSTDVANGFWVYTLYLPEVDVVSEYTILSEDIVLPVAYRTGYKFIGWMNGETAMDKIVQGSYGDLNLVAKWVPTEYEVNLKLNGGLWDSSADFSNATLKAEFTIKNYLTYQAATGADVALMNKTGSLYWGYIALKETAVKGLYEITQIVNVRSALTDEADMYITWHDGCTDASAKATLNGMFNAKDEYIGQYIYLENVPSDGVATKECNITAKAYTKDGVVITGEPNNKYTIEEGFVLPTPSKAGCEFLGWFDGETKVEVIPVGSVGNRTLVAQWYDPEAKLPINYQLNGGSLADTDPKDFVAKEGLATLPTPVNPGYNFLGWFKDEACTEAITSIEAGRNTGVTIYASWEMLTFKIEYDMDGGIFLNDEIVPKYDTFELLVEDFLNDYATLYSLTDVTATSFYGKSSKYGVYTFFKNEEMAAKWNWLLDYMYQEAVKVNYDGKASMQLSATAANFNKYMRVNLSALFQETRLTTVSPVSMDYTNIDCEAFWQACPTKVIQVGIEAKYEYTALDLPLQLATPNKEGATFVGWYTNEDLKNGKISVITAENIGDFKLYARWSDSTVVFDTYEIQYVLNGGTLPEDAPTTYVEETGTALKDAIRAGYKFVGWYLDVECTQKVESISAETKGNVTLYAAYEAIDYKIEFNAGEGQLPNETVYVGDYVDYEAWVKDFVVDFNTYGKKTVAADGSDFFARSWVGSGSLGYEFLTSETYSEKWGWMLTLINEVRVANGKTALTAEDVQAEARGEIHNLLNRCGNGEKGGNAEYGCDYTSSEVYEKVWNHIEKVHPVLTPMTSMTYNIDMLPLDLPQAIAPEGKKFAGWCLNEDLSDEAKSYLPEGTTGNLTIYAKYISESQEMKYTISYELNGGMLSADATTEYVAGTTLAITATATKVGYKFVGWYFDAECTKEAKEISASSIGNVTLYAKFELLEFTIKFENVEGLTEKVMKYGEELPTPEKDGFLFCGWFDNPECIGTIVTVVKEDATYYALWEEVVEVFDHNEVEVVVDASGNGDYKTLDEAISAVSDNTVIKVVAGEYTLNTIINKSVTIKGEGAETTVVTMAKDLGTALDAETIIIDGVTIKGAGGANNGGVYFQPSAKAHIFTVKNSIISDMNTFIKSINNVTNPMIITIENTEITRVGQFLMWITNGVETVNFVGNTVNVGSCGTIANEWAALFRTRIGAMKVYGNEFTGTTPAIDGIFEASVDCNGIDVKYNTFSNVTKFIHINTTGKPIVFDQNLYLDAQGNVLTTTPSAVVADGVTVDTTVATSAEDVATRFEAGKVSESTIKFSLGEGSIQDNFAEYRKHDGYTTMLPTARLYDHYFLGWCLNEDLSDTPTMVLVGAQAETVTLYAKFQQIPMNKIEYELNGGELGPNSPTEWKEGTSVQLVPATKQEADFAGWYLNPECTGEPVTEISSTQKGNIKLYAKWANWEFKTITYEVNEGTLPADAPTRYAITMGVSLENVIPTREGYTFLGWYNNAECTGTPITEISKEATEDVVLYALWTADANKFDITYHLNGGNTMYATREELVNDFLKDFSAVANKTITASNFTTTAREAEFTALLADDDLWAKWKWLFAFIASTDQHAEAPKFYEKVLNDRDGTDPSYKWFLTRDFGGFVNKTLANFWFSVSPVDYTVFANADGFWDTLQETYSATDVNTLLTPYRPYYVFEGWYDNAECTGTPVVVPSADCELYAKWSKETVTLTYVLGDVEATLDQTEVLVHVSDSFDLATPTYNSEYLKFNGWYLEPECVTIVRDVKEYTTENMTVYASWTEISGYTINYVLNGGSLIYQDRDALVADFLADYNEAAGHTYATAEDIASGNFADIDYHTAFTKILADGTNMREKWLWLAEYIYELSVRDLAANNCNVLGLKALINNTSYTGDAIYGLSYAFRAFLKGTTMRAGSSYTSVDFTVYENAHGFWDKLSAAENGEYLNNKGEVTLPTAYLENYKFAGWYTNPECTGEPVTTVNAAATLYAKYVEATPVESVSIDNKITEILRFETHQLQWSINPSNANIQSVKFESSDSSVATISSDGLITAVTNGTTIIKMTSLSPSGKSDEFTLTVYSPDHFDISYETESYTTVGGTIKLLANYIKRDNTSTELVWSSLNEDIATVDNTGVVTGVKVGQATIRVAAKDNSAIQQDFVVTILGNDLSAELQYIIGAHNSNIFTRYELGIGAGTPAYYMDIIGSVSNILFNDPLTINDSYLAAGNAKGNNSGVRPSTEFITVHYTGNMGKGANAAANANYFVGTMDASIHYTTGNDGIYQCMDNNLIAWHAGDGASSVFEWTATGVMYDENDPKWPTFGVSANAKFEINGKETSILIPEGTTAQTKRDKVAGTGDRWINDMGLAWKVENGQYYMGTTWWCYTQVAEGRICSKGGNRYSVGIESCVDKGSDLWFTWQRTAKLVASLMLEFNLDITRVKGHHFYAAKDCPQPLLENDLEIWWIFIDMVEQEYELLTTFKDATVSFTSNSETVDNHGRVVEQPLFSEVVTYTVTMNGQSITLATAVQGMYNKDCSCN